MNVYGVDEPAVTAVMDPGERVSHDGFEAGSRVKGEPPETPESTETVVGLGTVYEAGTALAAGI